MTEVGSIELKNKQRSYFDSKDEEGKVVISKEYILAPDDDFFRAISMEEFVTGAKDHIRGLYKQNIK